MKKMILASLLLYFSLTSFADKPKLAFIIDDIGHSPIPLQISTLPKEISLAIIPFTTFDSQAAYQAYSEGREVMLHLPMQSLHVSNASDTLTLNMSHNEFNQKVYDAINRIPYAVAVNNHMGSELTQHSRPMSWLMEILEKESMGFIDSRTTPNTVAQELADKQGIANNRRHVFLDHEQTESFITAQFNTAVLRASNSEKPVIVIGHPHKITLKTLNKLLSKFESEIELVPISSALISNTKTEFVLTE